MSARTILKRQLAEVRRLTLGSLDCVDESRNNLDRSEWELLEKNLRTILHNGARITLRRKAVLILLRQARTEEE